MHQGVINNLPQIPNLEHDSTIFLTSGKRALQSIAEALNPFFGISIRNARFDKEVAQLKRLNPLPADLLECLSHFTALIERVLRLQNSQDHTPKNTVIQNFHITANELLSPMWQVIPESGKPMLPEMLYMLRSLIELAELSFFHSLMENLASPFACAYVVEEIPAADRKEGSAIRFRCEVTFARPPRRQT